MYFPAPERHTGVHQCARCGGRGVTGDQYEMPVGNGETVLVVDQICGRCGGCGRDDEHQDCAPTAHATWDRGEDWERWDDELLDELEDPNQGPSCMSCCGRKWNAVQGLGDDEVVYLRVPCGCAEPMMVPHDHTGPNAGGRSVDGE